MDELTTARRRPAILGGLGGVLLLVLEASPRYRTGLPALLAGDAPGPSVRGPGAPLLIASS